MNSASKLFNSINSDLKVSIYLITAVVVIFSCSSTRRLANSDKAQQTIETTDNPPLHASTPSSKRVYKDGRRPASKDLEGRINGHPNLNSNGDIENSSALQFKYSLLTNVPVEAMSNLNLLYYMEEWYGTRYKYGGNTKKGIDCSAFTMRLLSAVFNITIPRTSREQYKSCEHIELNELHEGDLVFFHTRKGISHVGVYLFNNKFVHASLSNGVMISDMGDSYFVKRYIGAGRVKQNM